MVTIKDFLRKIEAEVIKMEKEINALEASAEMHESRAKKSNLKEFILGFGMAQLRATHLKSSIDLIRRQLAVLEKAV